MKKKGIVIAVIICTIMLLSSCHSAPLSIKWRPGATEYMEKWSAEDADFYFYPSDERFGGLSYGVWSHAGENIQIICDFPAPPGQRFSVYSYPESDEIMEGSITQRKNKMIVCIDDKYQDAFGEKITFTKEYIDRDKYHWEQNIQSYYLKMNLEGYDLHEEIIADSKSRKRWSRFQYAGREYDLPVITFDTERKLYAIFFSDGKMPDYRGTYEWNGKQCILSDEDGSVFFLDMLDDNLLRFDLEKSDRMEFKSYAGEDVVMYQLTLYDNALFEKRN